MTGRNSVRSVLFVCTMLVWRALMAGVGSPLSVGVASRVLFIGQLGKYLPGSVWPVLAQMELASDHKVPRARTAAASVTACSWAYRRIRSCMP